MNIIDKKFYELVQEIKSLSEMELYHRIRLNFEKVPTETKVSCMNFLINLITGED